MLVLLVALALQEPLDHKDHLGQRGQQVQQFCTVSVIHKG
jgi:hypothetical protein